MIVLHVYKDYFPPTIGGIEKHVAELAHFADVDCRVLTSSRGSGSRVDDDHGVPVIRSRSYGRVLSTPITPGWLRTLRSARADILHFHMPSPMGELALLATKTGVPVVATYHADIVGRYPASAAYVPFQQAFLRRARRIIVASPPMAETSPALRNHRDRTVVIPYGVDTAGWEARPRAADELRSRHPGPLVVFLGRLVHYKNLDLMIEAMPAIDATFLVVGDGPLRPALERQTRRLGLADKVIFAGQVADEARAIYYHAADVFVLPSASRAEAFGLSMLEAMACGTPAISTALGTGTSWLNVDGETGVVVQPGSPARLAEAVNLLLSDGERRRRMGHAAAERARRSFDRSSMVRATADLYASLMTGHTRHVTVARAPRVFSGSAPSRGR